MSKKAPWPIHKVFRSQTPNDINSTRSPSPIVEMPLSPDPETANNGTTMSPRYPSSVERSLSPRRSQSPFSTSLNKGVREIPIEVEHEVTIYDCTVYTIQCCTFRQGNISFFFSLLLLPSMSSSLSSLTLFLLLFRA